MKKSVLVFSLVFCGAALFSLEIPEQFVEAGTGYVAAKNVEREFNPFNLVYGVRDKSLQRTGRYEAVAGIQFSDKIFDLTVAGDYFIPYTSWRFDSSAIDIGAGILYHFQRYYSLYSEHDFYLDSIFRFTAFDKLVFIWKAGSGGKAALIDSLDHGAVWDFTFSALASLTYYFDCGAEIYGSVSSHELFRYPLFYTPSYTLGFAWNFRRGIRLSSDIGIRMRDRFVVAPYLDRFEWNIKARYTF